MSIKIALGFVTLIVGTISMKRCRLLTFTFKCKILKNYKRYRPTTSKLYLHPCQVVLING